MVVCALYGASLGHCWRLHVFIELFMELHVEFPRVVHACTSQ